MPPQNVSIIGILPSELNWVRKLVTLLRHPDPSVCELARQALLYLTESAARRDLPARGPLNHAG
jgi:hypothetical protein